MKKILILSLLVTLSVSAAFAQEQRTPMFRYYNSKISKHFFTVNFNEMGNGHDGYVFEGIAFRLFRFGDPGKGIIPFLRYFNGKTGDHYYTAHFGELGYGTEGYTLEGKAGFISKFQGPGLIPLFEYFNRSSGNHFYTVDKSELGRGFDGYALLGIAGYVYRAK